MDLSEGRGWQIHPVAHEESKSGSIEVFGWEGAKHFWRMRKHLLVAFEECILIV